MDSSFVGKTLDGRYISSGIRRELTPSSKQKTSPLEDPLEIPIEYFHMTEQARVSDSRMDEPST